MAASRIEQSRVDGGAVLTREAEHAGAVDGAMATVRRRLQHEWRSTSAYDAMIKGPRATGFAARPRDPRPVDAALGRQILAGSWTLANDPLNVGPGGDPFDQASPSRRFATELHRFSWAGSLLSQEGGKREGLRLLLAWKALFDKRPTPFAWGVETIERRVFNLACTAPALAEAASDIEAQSLAQSLARQARHLLKQDEGLARHAERLTAAACAGVALSGQAGDAILAAALKGLGPALEAAVPPDGTMRTRSPEQGLELLLDLLALDDGLLQRGHTLPEPIARALDRLGAGLRFFVLGDGRLARMNGGEAAAPERVAAALDLDDAQDRSFDYAPNGGVHRLQGLTVQVMVDAGPAPGDGWSVAACAHPLALEIVCGTDRLITNCGWSADSGANAALRLTAAGSTVSLGDGSCGHPLSGGRAQALGPRLTGGAQRVDSRRQENETGAWLELAHDGWVAEYGLIHERRLFLDPSLDELRGEDAFVKAPDAKPASGPRRQIPYAARFHLPPEVRVSLARDKRSVLLRGPSDRGWWFRNDAPDVSIEPSSIVDLGEVRRSQQIVLCGHLDPETGGRVRWKLTPVEPTPVPRLPLRRRDPAGPDAPG